MDTDEKFIMLEKLAEDLENELEEAECDIVVQEEESINIYLDLPETENYNYFIEEVERFFRNSRYDVEDFSIYVYYEGNIEIMYE